MRHRTTRPDAFITSRRERWRGRTIDIRRAEPTLLEASCPRDLDPQWHGEPRAELLHAVAPSAVAVEVQDDLRSVDDMVNPVRVDHVVDQDRAVVPEQESDRVRL